MSTSNNRSCEVVAMFFVLPGSLQQISKRAKVEVQVLSLEPEGLFELFHAVGESHERLSQTLDLFRREGPAFDAMKGLALHQLTQKLDDRQHEVRQALLELLRICRDPGAHRA